MRRTNTQVLPHSTMIVIDPTIQVRFGRALRRRTLAAFVTDAARSVGLKGEVSILLTGDDHIRRLNREFRRKDRPTDVLSFPSAASINGHRQPAGDIAISVETAARQADECNHPLSTELQILALHGLLHLGGYDHETDTGRMAREEAALRRRFGLATGLIERSTKPARKKAHRSRKP
ncbi:MAG: rRNA maturation RNase YbeY [Acidobacteriaceae bacterium]